MSLIVFITRGVAGLTMLIVVGISLDPNISKTAPDWHANSAATVASLFLTTLYFWPLIAEAKSRKLVPRMPTARSFTGRRFLTFGRWGLAFLESTITADYFLKLQFNCGMLSLIVVACLMPPLDRLLFAPGREMTARLKSDATFLKIVANLAAFTGFLSFGFSAQNDYTFTIYLLLISIGLLLVVPIVLLAKGGWKALSLKHMLLPVAVPDQPIETLVTKPPAIQKDHIPLILLPVAVPDQPVETLVTKPPAIQKDHIPRKPPTRSPQKTAPPPKAPIKRKYYSAKAWHWNWPIPKEFQGYPLKEQGFNMIIKGFETSWLESKDYHRRLALHRDPPTFLHEFIAEVEAYIQSMRLRYELQVRNKVMGIGSSSVGFVPDEVSKVWRANRKLRSLYHATQWYAQSPSKQSIMPFRAIAPHVAEYRAMINLVKHLRHSLSRMPGQHSIKVANKVNKIAIKINTPMQTEGITPIVFISYSWDSPEHEEWVINLATKLRENGVDAILDKWDLGLLGNLLPHFMETSISKSHRVICIMTPNYKKKTENLTGGVGYEYSIITAEIFTDSINTSKFIPLFRSGTAEDAIPAALKGRKYVDMRDNTQFDEKFIHELLRDIHNEPKFKKPAIGKKTKF
jgi:hypothetical protein